MHRISSIPIILLTLGVAACAGERPAEPQERTFVLEAARTARTLMQEQKRFLRSGIAEAPEIGEEADIVTSDGSSFFLRSDSVIGTVDSAAAEFLFRLRPGDTTRREAVVRTRRGPTGWTATGVYIRERPLSEK